MLGFNTPPQGRHGGGRSPQDTPAPLGFVEQNCPSTAPASLEQVSSGKRSCVGRTRVISMQP